MLDHETGLSDTSILVCSQLTSLHKAHSLRRKKRRNMLAIFGFRKNRNQAPNQGSESCAEVYGDVGPVVAAVTMGFVYTRTGTKIKPYCNSPKLRLQAAHWFLIVLYQILKCGG